MASHSPKRMTTSDIASASDGAFTGEVVRNILSGRTAVTPGFIDVARAALGKADSWPYLEMANLDRDPEPESFMRSRASRGQLSILISILEDCDQNPSIRTTAALELRAALDLVSA